MSRVYIANRGWVETESPVLEAVRFERTTPEKDPQILNNERRIEDCKRNIEHLINGTINYYHSLENSPPEDEGKVNELEQFSRYLTRTLNSYRNF